MEKDMDMVEALCEHIKNLTLTMDEMDPEDEQYIVISNAVAELSNIVVRLREIEAKCDNEEEQRKHEREIEELRQAAAKEAREAEERLKQIEQAEIRRWHTIDMALRIATISVSLLSLGLFGYTSWVQTRMNYVDNVYDVSGASRMILQAIGKTINPTIK